jgi:hypothetical protein
MLNIDLRTKTNHKGMTHQITVSIIFLSGKIGMAGTAGDRAAWLCECGYPTPLVGRSNLGSSVGRFTLCPKCSRKYIVHGSLFKRTRSVEEIVQDKSQANKSATNIITASPVSQSS